MGYTLWRTDGVRTARAAFARGGKRAKIVNHAKIITMTLSESESQWLREEQTVIIIIKDIYIAQDR